MALIDNLISYYKLDDNAANKTVLDSHGSNNGTTNTNTSNLSVTGKLNSAFDFNGSTEYFSTPLSLSGDYSVSLWVYHNGGLGTIIASGAGTNSRFKIYSTGSQFFFYHNDNSGTLVYDFPISVSTGVWTHVVITSESGSIAKFYKNGALGNSASIGADGTLDTSFDVGRDPGGGGIQYYGGTVDELGIWDRILTSTEVSYLYNSNNGLAFPFGVIQDSFTKTGISRIEIQDSFTKTGITRIKINDNTQVYDATSRIQINDTEFTKTGNSRIQINDTEFTKTSNSRILIQNQINKSGDARIEIQDSFTKTGSAYIRTGKAFDKSGNARIVIQDSFTKTSNARIKTQDSFDKSGNARIQIQDSFDKTGNASIVIRDSFDKSGNARISIDDTEFNKLGNARIQKQDSFTKTGSASIVIINSFDKTGNASISRLDSFIPQVKTIQQIQPIIKSVETFN